MGLPEIFIKLIVGYYRDQKFADMTELPWQEALAAEALYLRMACYCRENLSDGLVPAAEIPRLAYPAPRDVAESLVAVLDDADLIERCDSVTDSHTGPDTDSHTGPVTESHIKSRRNWRVRAYVKRNGTREDVERAVAQRTAASASRWEKYHVNAGRAAGRNASRNASRYAGRAPTESESETESESVDAGAGGRAGARATTATDGQTDLNEIVKIEIQRALGRWVSDELAGKVRASVLAGRHPRDAAAYLRKALREPGGATRHLFAVEPPADAVPARGKVRRDSIPAREALAAANHPEDNPGLARGFDSEGATERGGKLARELLAAKAAPAEQHDDDDDRDATPADAPF